MFRRFCLIAVGLAFGYSLGYKDARAHDRTVVERILDHAGASARGKYSSNVDERAERLEDR